GFPDLSTVASTMAFTSAGEWPRMACQSLKSAMPIFRQRPPADACANHELNCAIGFASKSARRNSPVEYSRLMSPMAMATSHPAERGQAEVNDARRESEADQAKDAHARRGIRRPVDQIAQPPRRDGEPDAQHHEHVGPNLDD